jgi:hypothetical protein
METVLEENTTPTTTVADYCRSVVAVEVKDEAIRTISKRRGTTSDADADELDDRTLDLLKADIFMWCQTLPNSSSQVKDSDSNWSHSEGGVRFTSEDKKTLRRLANDIYTTYGEESQGVSKFRIVSGGIGNIKRPL